MDAHRLQTIANASGRGHLKLWKATSMLATMQSLVPLSRECLREWVANCLEMEGFSDDGIDAITTALMQSTEQGV